MTKKSKSDPKLVEFFLKPETLLVIGILLAVISPALAYMAINNLLIALMPLISICIPILFFYFVFKLIFKK